MTHILHQCYSKINTRLLFNFSQFKHYPNSYKENHILVVGWKNTPKAEVENHLAIVTQVKKGSKLDVAWITDDYKTSTILTSIVLARLINFKKLWSGNGKAPKQLVEQMRLITKD